MMKSYLRSFRRQSLLRAPRWRFPIRLFCIMLCVIIFLSFLIPFIYSIFIFQLNYFEPDSSDTIISLTSTPLRFHYELPFAIHSLLSQTQLPKQIRIYLSPTSIIINQKNLTLRHLKIAIQHLDSSKMISKLFDRLVEIRLEQEDYGPATKFLPIIKDFASKSQAIMICDDDQYYHPYTLATLNEYANQFPNSILGFRGWRSKHFSFVGSILSFSLNFLVRQDLRWGVRGKYEIARHIIESQYLSEVYRVGILTATNGYLIRPSFFDAHIYLDFNQVSDDIRHVDDIWLNGQASKQNIARYVVPSCCSHISVTRTHELEDYLKRNNMNRLSANTHALQWFSNNWENNLWYRFKGENGPKYRDWWTMILREWTDLILQLKFIVYFGFI